MPPRREALLARSALQRRLLGLDAALLRQSLSPRRWGAAGLRAALGLADLLLARRRRRR